MNSSRLVRKTRAPADGASAGADLPGDYPAAQARLLVANPTTVWVEWGRHDDAVSFSLRALVDGTTETSRVDAPGHAREAWLTVWPNSRGVVSLVAHGASGDVELAELAFATPADGPSSGAATRWGRLDTHGNLHRDAPPVEGRALTMLASASTTDAGGYSSGSAAGRRPTDGNGGAR